MTSTTDTPTERQTIPWFDLLLIALIAVGIVFRLSWVNWNQDADLHPDEYGLTGTLTALRIPDSLGDYFNTRISPISPYQKYDINGQPIQNGPDNRMRWGQWPITLVRLTAEQTGLTGYTEMRLLGRQLSAVTDVLSLMLLFLIGEWLYSRRVGLLAAALGALAVMQIQQSHFLTTDNFAVLFTMLALFAAVRVAIPRESERGKGWVWYALFGVALGMAVASKVNLAPLAGMVALAALLRVSREVNLRADFWQAVRRVILPLALAGVLSLVAFRVTQPMAFRAPQGDTTILTLTPNPDWVESMKVASNELAGINAGPPGEQWTGRIPLVFPWTNMVIWGMGPLLGLAAWGGFAWAAVRAFRRKAGWRAHILPLVWVGGYFLFMGTRHVMSMRYFLPMYPFMMLFAAWGLTELWRKRSPASQTRFSAVGLSLTGVVLLGTLAWAWSFTGVVYRQDNTRIQATRWMYQNVPAPVSLQIASSAGVQVQPLNAPDGIMITSDSPLISQFNLAQDGVLQSAALAHVRTVYGDAGQLHVSIAADPSGSPLAETTIPIAPVTSDPRGGAASAAFDPAALKAGQVYYLIAAVSGDTPVSVSRTVLSNEDWDESLPVRMDGYDPFGQFYTGLTMGVRWGDDENKRQMILDTLSQADYIILPSQRAIWSVARLPDQYPMTQAYYRALFDGSLGFEQVAAFQHPFTFGPLYISDAGGQVSLGSPPTLPLFNTNLLASEEAFTVYDHAPVWIFKKGPNFNIDEARQILDAAPLPNE